MRQLIYRITEPVRGIPDDRKIFSDHDLKVLILPLFLEQLLEVLVGVSDTFMVSYAGEAAVSGVSLVNMFNTVFIFLFSALAAGGAVVVSQYIGSRGCRGCGLLYAQTPSDHFCGVYPVEWPDPSGSADRAERICLVR